MSAARRSVGRDASRSASGGPDDAPPILRVQLLGRFLVSSGPVELSGETWRSRKAAQLVKVLALAPNHALHREQLVDLLWPDLAPAAAANNLRQTLHVARGHLQQLPIDRSSLLRVRDERVALYPIESLEVDVEAFEAAARAVRGADDPGAYWAAIDRYRGPLLPDDPYEDWAASRREALNATYLGLLDDVARLHEEAGAYSSALAALRRLVELEPAHEDAQVRMMRLYALSGRRSQALRQYRQLAQALERDLDAAPEPATQALFERIKRGEMSSGPAEPVVDNLTNRAEEDRPSPGNLPYSLSSFIGREREVAEICRLIASHRLVTLTGPGGVGKTRLALEVGWKQTNRHRDGVWFVDLTGLTNPALLAQTVADALGIQLSGLEAPLALLIGRLSGRELLLIFDNCEHLIADCARFAGALLASCPKLRVLATSRESLRVGGGHPWVVPALPLPRADAGLAEIGANDAVRLFIDRVRWHRPELTLAAENAGAITQICRQLEGLPLALELAASRAAVLALPELANRLGDALGLLAGDPLRAQTRQQTLRATLNWSHELLDPFERVLFRRLAAFSGGWTLEAAEAVCAADGGDDDLKSSAVLGLLSQLVQKSLVLVEAGGETSRYRLLEPIRQYALERLLASGERDLARERHARYFLALAEEAEPNLTGPAEASWLRRIAQEQDNLRAALASLGSQGDHERALRLAAALGRFWWVHGSIGEGQRWLSDVLAAATLSDEPDPLRVKALSAAFTMAHRRGDYVAARSFANESLTLARRYGDRRVVAWALVELGMIAAESSGGQESLLTESLAIFREVGDTAGIAEALNMLGEVKRLQDDDDAARQLYEESLLLWRTLGDEQYVAMILHNLGRVAQRQGDSRRAAALLLESLTRFQDLGINNGIALNLRGLAGVAAGLGQLELAARFLGAAAALAERLGVVEDSADRAQTQTAADIALGGLGQARFATAWSAGKSLSLESVIDEAMRFPALVLEPGAGSAAGLTPREQAVARLVARGLTNQQIATELGAATRTIDTHVSRILRKLGVTSRHDIAARLAGIGSGR